MVRAPAFRPAPNSLPSCLSTASYVDHLISSRSKLVPCPHRQSLWSSWPSSSCPRRYTALLSLKFLANPAAVTATQLEPLPYLSAIIEEPHYLTFCLLGRHPRVCLDETLVFTSSAATGEQFVYRISPCTSMSTWTLLVHTEESILPDPWRFHPKR